MMCNGILTKVTLEESHEAGREFGPCACRPKSALTNLFVCLCRVMD